MKVWTTILAFSSHYTLYTCFGNLSKEYLTCKKCVSLQTRHILYSICPGFKIFTLSLSLNYIAITFHNILVGALVTTGFLGNVVNVLFSKQTHKTAIRQKATGWHSIRLITIVLFAISVYVYYFSHLWRQPHLEHQRQRLSHDT